MVRRNLHTQHVTLTGDWGDVVGCQLIGRSAYNSKMRATNLELVKGLGQRGVGEKHHS